MDDKATTPTVTATIAPEVEGPEAEGSEGQGSEGQGSDTGATDTGTGEAGTGDTAGEAAGEAGTGDVAGDTAGDAEPPEGPIVAPPWTGKVHYLVGGVLPAVYLPWVWHDLRGPGWRRRQAARPTMLVAPFAVVFALLPGQVGVRATVVAFILVATLGLGVGTSGYFRNRRLVQHGFAPVETAYADEDFVDEDFDE